MDWAKRRPPRGGGVAPQDKARSLLWTKSGVQFSNYKEDYLGGASGPGGESIKRRTNPLLDGYLAARYTENIADARKFGLLRTTLV